MLRWAAPESPTSAASAPQVTRPALPAASRTVNPALSLAASAHRCTTRPPRGSR